jgi:hypothetical protein
MIEMGELEYSIANKINVNGGDFPYSLGLNKNVLADHSVKECYLKFEYLYDLA